MADPESQGIYEPFGSVETMSRIEAERDARARRYSKSEGAPEPFELTSPAVAPDGRLPARNTADDLDASPELRWGEPPPDTESFALCCEDIDARSTPRIHWLIWNIPATARALSEGVDPSSNGGSLRQGTNDLGTLHYRGPNPVPGATHRYVFHLYALDTRPDLASGAAYAEFERALEHSVVAEATLSVWYGREPQSDG
jgi:Raf kinase inhibitor-like YbhB/YbcL family protein